MIDRLRHAYNRHHHGPEPAVLIQRVEDEIAAIDSPLITDEWLENLWSLPPQAWLDFVDLLRRKDTLLVERYAAIDEFRRRNWLLGMIEYAEIALSKSEQDRYRKEAAESIQIVEAMMAKARLDEPRYRDLAASFLDRFSTSSVVVSEESPEEDETPAPKRNLFRYQWDQWIEALPHEVREEAKQARQFSDIRADIEQRKRTLLRVLDRCTLENSSFDGVADLLQKISDLDRECNQVMQKFMPIAEYLFEEYGEPADLT